MLQPGGTDPTGKIDIPLSVVHLAEATSLGHVRAANFLAHGLFDSESWLRQYGRDEEVKRKKEAMLNTLFPNRTKETASHTPTFASSNLTRWKYNESQPLYIRLPTALVQLPYPLGGSQTSCKVSLTLLKHLAEHSYRTNDLMRAGLQSYANKNLWEALDHYDEAAELGVSGAQENAAFLYNEIMSKECPRSLSPNGNLLQLPPAEEAAFSDSSSSPASTATSSMSSSLQSSSAMSSSSFLTSFHPQINTTECTHYMERMAARRWLQLANTGDYVARREVARRLAEGRGTWERNATKAAILYGLAAEQGDVQSLMSLGWLLARGDGEKFPRNLTAARNIFRAALKAEIVVASKGYWHTISVSPYNTNGLAPLVALCVVWFEETFASLHSFFARHPQSTGGGGGNVNIARYAVDGWIRNVARACLKDKTISLLLLLFFLLLAVFVFRRIKKRRSSSRR